jgi:hypothetical protein
MAEKFNVRSMVPPPRSVVAVFCNT